MTDDNSGIPIFFIYVVFKKDPYKVLSAATFSAVLWS